MARPNPAERIQEVKYSDASNIRLSNGVGIEFFNFLKAITGNVLQAELNPNP